jgi:hypothetical protein
MAHHTFKNSYTRLIARLNLSPQGAPPSDVLYKILEMRFSRKEAAYPFSLQRNIPVSSCVGRADCVICKKNHAV